MGIHDLADTEPRRVGDGYDGFIWNLAPL